MEEVQVVSPLRWADIMVLIYYLCILTPFLLVATFITSLLLLHGSEMGLGGVFIFFPPVFVSAFFGALQKGDVSAFIAILVALVPLVSFFATRFGSMSAKVIFKWINRLVLWSPILVLTAIAVMLAS